MSIQTIYTALRAAGMTPEGACGMLGNMQAESGMKANIAQRGMTQRSDEDYTDAADMGLIDFAHDGVGYGLCQWTFWSRKQALLTFARGRGASVGDEATQIAFCIRELREDYPELWFFLCNTEDIYDATGRICKEYERPALNNINARYDYAQGIFSRVQSGEFGGITADTEESDDGKSAETPQETFWPPRMLDYREGRENLTGADVLALQALLAARGYDCPTTGDFDAKTRISVMAFQAESGLAGDGICGKATWGFLLMR